MQSFFNKKYIDHLFQNRFSLSLLLLIPLLLLFSMACSKKIPEVDANLNNPSSSPTTYIENFGASLSSRSTISNVQSEISLLSEMFNNSSYDSQAFALIDDGQTGEQIIELIDLTIAHDINATLPMPLNIGTYYISVDFIINDAALGEISIAQTHEEFVTIAAQQSTLPKTESEHLIFTDDDNDGFSNIIELIAGTDLSDALSLPLPSIPNNIALTQNLSDVTAMWSAVDGVESYNVFVAVINNGNLNTSSIYNTTSTSYNFSNIITADVLDVFVSVSAINFAGEGLSSALVSLNIVNNLGTGANSTNTSDTNISINAIPSPIIKFSPSIDDTNVKVSKKIKVEYDPLAPITKVWLGVTGVVPVTGSIKDSVGKIEFKPDNLDFSTTYIANVVFFMTDINGDSLEASYEWSFTTVADTLASSDTTPPQVSGLIPATDDVDVKDDSDITISFTEPVDEISLDGGIVIDYIDPITVSSRTTVTGRWGTRANTAVFTPNNPLPPATDIWVAVAAVTDLAGNQIRSRFGSGFRTAAAPATTVPAPTTPNPPPTPPPPASTPFSWVNSNPTPGAQGISINTHVTVTFSREVDIKTVEKNNGIVVSDQTYGVVITGKWRGKGVDAVFSPDTPLNNRASHFVSIAASVTDIDGIAIDGRRQSTFVTEDLAIDTISPEISTHSPTKDATNVDVTSKIRVSFSEDIDPANVKNGSAILVTNENGNPVAGSWRIRGSDIRFTPDVDLTPGSTYAIAITADIQDLSGNALKRTHNWSFKTL